MKIFLSISLILTGYISFAQGPTCNTADPFCTGTTSTFPGSVNTTAASTQQPGNNYNCLSTSPNPAWYYMEIATPGNLDITMTNSANVDIDFIMYGPYTSLANAMASCGSMGTAASGSATNTVIDCSYSTAATEVANITNAQAGQVYVLLITNFSNQNTNISFTNTGGTATTDCSIVNPCSFTGINANIGACNPATNTYSTTGTVTYVDPPTTGQLIIQDCNGVQQTFNPPFSGTTNFTLNNQNANGAACNITATFTANPACTINLGGYTAPQCQCLITNFTANIGACQAATSTYSVSGTIEFTSPPTTGTLTVTTCQGQTQTFNAPFVSPLNYNISGVNANGGACNVSVAFSANAACNQNIPYTSPAGCTCPAEAGNFNAGTTGSTNNTGPYNLCFGDALNINSTGGFVPANNINDPTIPYDPGLWLLVYSCPPTVVPQNDINNDPCLLGVFSTANGNWNIPNTTGNGQTLYFVPVTMYSMSAGYYSVINTNALCYDLGPTYQVTYLPQVTQTNNFDCVAGTATATINGGAPALGSGQFTASNLSPANASFVNTTTGNGGTITISGLQNGQNYSWTVTDVNGCPVTVSGGPFVAAVTPTVNAAGPFCPADPAFQMTASNPGGTWSATCGACITAGGSFNPVTAGPGNHTITYTIPGACGGSGNITVTVDNAVTPTINPAGPFCANNPVAQLAGNPAGGTWSATCGACITAGGQFNPTTAGPGNHTVTYTIAGSCGGSTTANISVIANSNATVNPAGPFCTSSPAVVLTAAEPGGVWSATCGACINAATGQFNPATAGAGNWTITYTLSGACGHSDTEVISVSQQLNATITPVGPFCANDPAVVLTAVNPGGTWTATCGACINSTTGLFNPAVANPGVHTVTYTLAGACGDQQTLNITINPLADAAILPAGPFCLGFGNTTITALNAGGTWSASCGACIDPATGTFNTTVAGVGLHTITYNLGGPCPDSESIQVQITPNADAGFVTANPLCDNNNPSALVPNTPGGTWSATCGPCVTPNGFFNPTTAGAGTHTVTYTIPGACGGTTSQDIVVNPSPQVNFVADVTSGCIPLAVNFTDQSAPAGTTYNWIFGDGSMNTTAGNASHTYNTVGCHDVTVVVTTALGCTNTLSIPNYICVNAYAVADFVFGPQDATILNPEINFTNLSTNASSYEWTFSTLGTSTAVNPSFVFPNDPADSYLVCLAALNGNGCHDTICQIVTIYDEFLLYVPNAFTPDGDGKNDIFIPVINGVDQERYALYIFNRWGELIYETQHAGVGWDGHYNNYPSPDGVYVWKLVCRDAVAGEKKQFVGHVTLLR